MLQAGQMLLCFYDLTGRWNLGTSKSARKRVIVEVTFSYPQYWTISLKDKRAGDVPTCICCLMIVLSVWRGRRGRLSNSITFSHAIMLVIWLAIIKGLYKWAIGKQINLFPWWGMLCNSGLTQWSAFPLKCSAPHTWYFSTDCFKIISKHVKGMQILNMLQLELPWSSNAFNEKKLERRVRPGL